MFNLKYQYYTEANVLFHGDNMLFYNLAWILILSSHYTSRTSPANENHRSARGNINVFERYCSVPRSMFQESRLSLTLVMTLTMALSSNVGLDGSLHVPNTVRFELWERQKRR